jgi:hypothetical protein
VEGPACCFVVALALALALALVVRSTDLFPLIGTSLMESGRVGPQ